MEPSNDTAAGIAKNATEPSNTTASDVVTGDSIATGVATSLTESTKSSASNVDKRHIVSVQDGSGFSGRASGGSGARVLAMLKETGAVFVSKAGAAAEPVTEM